MKRFQALLVAGGILALLGVYVVNFGILPFDQASEQVRIPPGADYYYSIAYDLDAGLHFAVDFSVASGGTVDVSILDGAGYDYYREDLAGPSLAFASGASGSLAIDVLAGGRYYITFDHGSGSEGGEQLVEATVQAGGLAPTFVVPGVALVVVGTGVAAVGWRRKQKALAGAAPSRRATDVLLFSEPKFGTTGTEDADEPSR